MKLKVCLIIPTLVQGGAEKQLSLLACNLDRNKFETHVVVLTHSGPFEKELSESGIKVHIVGKRWKVDPTSFLRLMNLIQQIRPDIVHTWLFAANSYGRLAASLAKVPVIIGGERCVDPWKTLWHDWIDRWMMRCCSCIATNSSAITDFYVNKGLPAELFQVVPNAIVPTTSTITKQELFDRLQIPPRKFVIGAIGRLWPQKGYPDLIWASELTRIVLKDIWVIIVGDGPQRDRLIEIRDHYRAESVLKFAGHRDDARQLLSAFDLLWNGSLYEGQSNTILEAMAAGVPVIATDIPGNRDLVEHGKTGYLYPVGEVDQLSRYSCVLLSDPERLNQFSQNSRQRVVDEFSLEKMVNGYQRLYETLFEQSRQNSDNLLRFYRRTKE